MIEEHLADSRRGKNTQFPFADLLRQSVYSRLAGYEDLNDAQRLSQDPTFRLIGSEKNWDRGAALTSRLQTFETEMLAEEENFAGLGRLNRALVGKAEITDSGYRTVLDMDSTEITVYGEQEQSAYNGHFESTCYHPLLLFNREGDCLGAKLRPGVVAKVEFHFGELFPRVGFIVTNLEADSGAVVRFYNKRGTAEQWIKEGKQAVKMTRLSCHRFRSNEVRLWLSVIAYNLGNLWRRLVLPRRIGNWSLTSLQQRLVKTGGRLLKHARYYWLLLAESHLTRRLFASMLGRIVGLSVPSG